MANYNSLIRLSEVQRRTGYSKAWIYRLISQGRFPKQVKIGSRAIAFVDPTYLLRTYVSSAGIGLNEQKDHAEGKLGFQSWGEPS